MDFEFDNIFKKAQSYGQGHLLAFYQQLTISEQKDLLEQIAAIDFELMEELYKSAISNTNNGNDFIEPLKFTEAEKLTRDEIDIYMKIGINKISKGQVAAVTMAGGQGTRLGHNGPKGTYDIGLDSHKSLFEIQCDSLKASNALSNSCIPWYIMTSEDNNDATVSFFDENNYFGYPKENIFFFKQGMLPMLSSNGKILLSQKDKVLTGADGNGGLFLSLKKSGAIEDMAYRGVKWLSICGIDNVLINLADPIFIGYTINTRKKAAAKSVAKISPEEKGGVFCKRNGHPGVVEYTELSKEMAYLCDERGRFVYNDINIVSYLIDLDIIIKISDKGMPYHTAIKKATYIDSNGDSVSSEQPDSFKFETFLFDSFKYIDDMEIFRVKRENEFAPVKNKTGEDSPETAKKMYLLKR